MVLKYLQFSNTYKPLKPVAYWFVTARTNRVLQQLTKICSRILRKPKARAVAVCLYPYASTQGQTILLQLQQQAQGFYWWSRCWGSDVAKHPRRDLDNLVLTQVCSLKPNISAALIERVWKQVPRSISDPSTFCIPAPRASHFRARRLDFCV